MEYSRHQIMLNKINQIRRHAIIERITLPNWEMRRGYYAAPGEYRIESDSTPFTLGDHWRCGDGTTCWFKTTFTLPANWTEGIKILDLDFGGEGIVRINGEIRSAITSYYIYRPEYRTRVYLPQTVKAGDTIDIEVECALNYLEFGIDGPRMAGGKDTEYTLKIATASLLDPAVESFYFDAVLAYDTMLVLENPYAPMARGSVRLPAHFAAFMDKTSRDTYLYDRVREALQGALALADIDFERQRVVESLPRAKEALATALAAIPHHPMGKIYLTGHSHIDTAWFWPVKETVRKAAKTFSNALSLMELYPEYIFAHSQPWQYEKVKEHYPELFEKIKARVTEGRWELIGNSWVEADSNVPSGESLVRQLLYGRAFYLREFGKSSDIYWMPDVFGYSWALPQIIRRSGLKYFFTAKLANNDVNKFPYTLFTWQGIDGSQVPAYLHRLSYNSELRPEPVTTIYQELNEKSLHNKGYMTFGFGDGGGGPTYEMLEYGKRMKAFPGLPETEIVTSDVFFKEVPTEGLPLWNDEMYYEYHRGTYTSQAQVKKNNRKGELLYRGAEIASVFAGIFAGHAYPMESLIEGWKLILLNQFHDTLPGSSIHDVYEDCKADYAKVMDLGEAAESAAFDALSGAVALSGDSVIVYNLLGWERQDMVTVPLSPSMAHLAPVGLPYEKASTEEGALLRFPATVPAMGYRTIPLGPETVQEAAPITGDARHLETPFYTIRLNENGEIVSLYDKKAGRQVLRDGEIGNRMIIFEDKPAVESAWNIDIEYKNKFWELCEADAVTLETLSPLRAVIAIKRSFNKSTILQRMVVYAHTPRIDFQTEVHWQESEKMLKAAFPVEILSPKATYEIAYGAIERPTHANTTWDKAKFEVPAHKWADLSEGNYGVALLNDCKYGYDIQGSVMRITLLKSPVYPDPTGDKGDHSFTYSLYPHRGDWREGNVVREGYGLNVPFTAVAKAPQEGTLAMEQQWLSLDGGDSLIIDTIKESENRDGIILRLYESHGGRGQGKITLNIPAKEVYETNLMEDVEREIPLSDGAFAVDYKPYEIKTYLIR